MCYDIHQDWKSKEIGKPLQGANRHIVSIHCKAIILLFCIGLLIIQAVCATSRTHSIALSPVRIGSPTVQSPNPHLAAAIKRYIASMTLEQRVGQLFVLQFTTADYTAESTTMIRRFQPGGVILYQFEMSTIQQTRTLVKNMQDDAIIPLLVCSDVEGGAIDNLATMYPDGRPNATQMGRTGDVEYIYQQGEQTAHDMKSVGLNVNLAPDVDVMTANGPDQINRTFSTDPRLVTQYATAYLDGL